MFIFLSTPHQKCEGTPRQTCHMFHAVCVASIVTLWKNTREDSKSQAFRRVRAYVRRTEVTMLKLPPGGAEWLSTRHAQTRGPASVCDRTWNGVRQRHLSSLFGLALHSILENVGPLVDKHCVNWPGNYGGRGYQAAAAAAWFGDG